MVDRLEGRSTTWSPCSTVSPPWASVGRREASGPSIARMSQDTADRLAAELDMAKATLDAVPAPLADSTDSAAVGAADAAVRSALVTLRTEVASQLGITLQLGDADGDS